MATFTERDNSLDAIAREIARSSADLDNAVALFTTVKDRLNNLQATYTGLSSEIDTEATNNPNDDAIQAQKDTKDKYLADFMDEKTRATNLETAVSGL